MNEMIVSGSFDDLRTRHIRFLHEASRLGKVHVLLWSDEVVSNVTGQEAKFNFYERLYFLDAIRYVSRITRVDRLTNPDELPLEPALPESQQPTWVVDEEGDNPARRAYCHNHRLGYIVIRSEQVQSFPILPPFPTGRKKVVVTGCYDWLHTGHVRFFEECAQLGDLYVVVGNDANVENLKGPGHPMFPQAERRYLVHSIRYVTQGLITSGWGWMDAEPEIAVLNPDIYAVNEDGDKPEKRAFCAEHGLEYVVLKRLPKEGLPRRESTNLRGF